LKAKAGKRPKEKGERKKSGLERTSAANLYPDI
jgi:hypothetical protein